MYQLKVFVSGWAWGGFQASTDFLETIENAKPETIRETIENVKQNRCGDFSGQVNVDGALVIETKIHQVDLGTYQTG